MRVARNLGLVHVIFEMDLAEIACALNRNTYKLDYSSTFIKDYHGLIDEFSSAKFMHIKRSCNKVVHELTKLVLDVERTKVWVDGGPHEIMAFAMTDRDFVTLH